MTSIISVKPTILGKSIITETNSLKDSTDAKWIELKELKYTDQDGKKRRWEMASRKTTNSSGVDAVAICSILKHPVKEISTIIILQYRPPVGTICVEFPAGLIDSNENATEAGIRELYEETGYGGDNFKDRIKVIELGGVVPSDPGMSSANMNLLTLEVELKEGEETPIPKLEPGEHIEVRVTPLATLYQHLQEYEKLGYSVDARLHHFSAGIETAKRLSLFK